MILVDTSIWIDFLRNTDDSLRERLTGYLENGMAVGLIDCYLLAAAKANNCDLWTLDKRLLDAFHKL